MVAGVVAVAGVDSNRFAHENLPPNRGVAIFPVFANLSQFGKMAGLPCHITIHDQPGFCFP